jgi:hypothetical protein
MKLTIISPRPSICESVTTSRIVAHHTVRTSLILRRFRRDNCSVVCGLILYGVQGEHPPHLYRLETAVKKSEDTAQDGMLLHATSLSLCPRWRRTSNNYNGMCRRYLTAANCQQCVVTAASHSRLPPRRHCPINATVQNAQQKSS